MKARKIAGVIVALGLEEKVTVVVGGRLYRLAETGDLWVIELDRCQQLYLPRE